MVLASGDEAATTSGPTTTTTTITAPEPSPAPPSTGASRPKQNDAPLASQTGNGDTKPASSGSVPGLNSLTCVEDPSCNAIASQFGCTYDLHGARTGAPVGTLVSSVCPISCGVCRPQGWSSTLGSLVYEDDGGDASNDAALSDTSNIPEEKDVNAAATTGTFWGGDGGFGRLTAGDYE